MAKYPVLDKFYKNKRWQDFRTAYIVSRIKRDGGSLCDYCGEWIDNPHEITLHHEEELTPDNINDVMVALNPDNIKQIHASCHNTIHKHAGHKPKRIFLVYGPPMSGKTTYVKRRAWRGDIIVDMDSLYQAVSGLSRYDKPNSLYHNVIAVQNLLLDHIKTRYGRWDNAWVIGGYPDRYKRERLAKELGAEVIYKELSREECKARVKLDVKRQGRYKEWCSYIDKWFDRFTQ